MTLKIIPLHGKNAHGRVALVSDGKYELVSQYRWRVMERILPNGTRCGPYAQTTIPTGKRGGRVTLMHILITGYRRTDHINGNGLDNQDHNLREATHAENMANRAGNQVSTSQYKGVSWNRTLGYWVARIYKGSLRRCAYFHDEQEAARTYDTWAVELFGAFAWLNFPPSSEFAAHPADQATASGLSAERNPDL